MKICGNSLTEDDYPTYRFRVADFVYRNLHSLGVDWDGIENIDMDWNGLTVFMKDGTAYRGEAVGLYVRDYVDGEVPMDFRLVS